MIKTLRDVALVIRSKNSGPFELTMDIIFKNPQIYEKIKSSGIISEEKIAELYKITVDKIITFVWYDAAIALKITIVRPIDSGSIGERDTYGAQQHAPLLSLKFDLDEDNEPKLIDKYGILTKQDLETLSNAKMGRNMGFGKKIALLVIDAQVYMIGDKCEPMAESNKKYPSSCGEIGWHACENIKRIIDTAHTKNIPVFYSQMTMASDGWDAGVYTLKRNLLRSDNWMLEGTAGWEIAPMLKPTNVDHLFIKKKPSAFFGTPLISYLNDKNIDTLIITGGSTSNCVRATVFDASSYNYHVIVAEDGVFDRIEISHKVSLFDMNRQWADVIKTNDIIDELSKY